MGANITNSCTSEPTADPATMLTIKTKELEKLQEAHEETQKELEETKAKLDQLEAAEQRKLKVCEEFSTFIKAGNFSEQYEIDTKLDEIAAENEVEVPYLASVLSETAKTQLAVRKKTEPLLNNYANLVQLRKFRKGGRKAAKDKHVLFTHVDGKSYVDWSDQPLDDKRVIVVGVSLDESLVDRKMNEHEKERFLVIQTSEGKNIVFLAKDLEERDQLVKEFRSFVDQNEEEKIQEVNEAMENAEMEEEEAPEPEPKEEAVVVEEVVVEEFDEPKEEAVVVEETIVVEEVVVEDKKAEVLDTVA